jgi:hypothetical protein
VSTSNVSRPSLFLVLKRATQRRLALVVLGEKFYYCQTRQLIAVINYNCKNIYSLGTGTPDAKHQHWQYIYSVNHLNSSDKSTKLLSFIK